MRTLLLGEDRPARYQLGPHKLPIEPAQWPVGTATPAERVLKELHAELAMRGKLREPRIPAQLVATDMRLDLGGDRVTAEVARELGPAADTWLAHWSKASDTARLLDPLLAGDYAFPGVGFFEKREVAKLADAAADAAGAGWKEVETAPPGKLWRPFAAIALRHPAAPAAAVARALDTWRNGPPALRGDGDAIRELLVEKLTTAGGEVRTGKLGELGVSWGKISSITLASGDDIGAGQVVASMDPGDLATLLGKKAPKRLSELAEGMEVVGYRYSFNIVIDEAGLPEHMAPTVAVVGDPDKEPVGESAFSIHLGESDDGGRVVATIATVLASDGPLDADRLQPRGMALRSALWRRLGEGRPL